MSRGLQKQDHQIFAQQQLSLLRKAVSHLNWLLSQGYHEKPAIQLIGDHFQLTARQRFAVKKCSCSNAQIEQICKYEQKSLAKKVILDGLNIIVTLEVILNGGPILKGRDGVYRDLASVHGSYSIIPETGEALLHLGNFLQNKNVVESHFYIDKPVKNSGRLKQFILELARQNNWHWHVHLMDHCDQEIIKSNELVISADRIIICQVPWYNLLAQLVQSIPHLWIVDLSG